MKKSIIIGAAVALLGASLSSCDDFLNDNRYPLSQQVVNSEFWSNSVNVENQINYFYEDYLGYGNATGSGNFYFKWTTDDQCGRTTFAQWLNQNVPTASSNWSGPYTEIRRACLVMQGVEGSTLPQKDKDNYTAQARLHRGRQYFELVKRYGDVPLVKEVLDPSMKDELYMGRTPRNEVIDFAVADIEYATKNIAAQNGKTVFSKDMAQAVLCEVCLYEASYARYHQKNEARAKEYYQKAVAAGEAIAAKYPICDDYTSLYKSFRAEGGGYKGLTTNNEVIFMKAYEPDVLMHSTVDYSSASDGIAGLTRDAFDAFLLRDGNLGTSSTDAGVPVTVTDEDGTVRITNVDIQALLDVRDKRLEMTTYPMLVFQGYTWAGPNTAPMYSMSGYGVSKYDNWTISNSDATTANKQYTCSPLFWGARIYLDILEAKAELGNLTDADLTKYMAPLWKRGDIDLSKCTVAHLSSLNDPANDRGVSSLVWEIRRCRRCELMMDDDIRYWDLVRWHMLDKLDTKKYPTIIQGANVSMVTENKPECIGDYLDCSYGQTREFNDRQYLFPIPSDQIGLNTKLTQNPGWN